MNPDIASLQPYPFQRLNRLYAEVTPNPEQAPIALSIGEPRHPPPPLVTDALATHLEGLGFYPTTHGSDALRTACARWLTRRHGLPPESIEPARHVLPVNGTREALFALAQATVDRSRDPVVVLPNPFYQIYEGAALLAGAQPYFVNHRPNTPFDFDAVPGSVWDSCQLLYLCTPSNPTGTVIPESDLQTLIGLAERHDFIIASDECYSEIYRDEALPPPGLLGAAARMGNDRYDRCVVFQSLSKRSSVPGLRSGFVAGDARVLSSFLTYRTYHGCAMAPPTQAASIAAWSDEGHVAASRQLYREKFEAVVPLLQPWMDVEWPEGGFCLWPRLPMDDTRFAQRLYAEQNVRVLPGSYLSREAHGANPGAHRLRIALVAPKADCIEAAQRMTQTLSSC